MNATEIKSVRARELRDGDLVKDGTNSWLRINGWRRGCELDKFHTDGDQCFDGCAFVIVKRKVVV